jgi:hypothetical protein
MMPSSVYLHDGEHQITVRFPTEADRERFKAHYRAIDAHVVRFRDENERLRAALAFAASCIKAGEPWTPECERIIDGALKGRTE